MSGPASLKTSCGRFTNARRVRMPAALVIVSAWAVASAVACGGTTGKQGSSGETTASGSSDAGSDATSDATPDATMNLAEGGALGDNFDATIEYADAGRLPKVATDAGSEGGQGDAAPVWKTWPSCPCDTIDPTTAGLIPSTAPGCSPSEVTWLRRPVCDSCVRGAGLDSPVFPPCCDARDAGFAAAGSAKGSPIFDLCGAADTCFVQSDCASDTAHANAYSCYCGTAGQGTDCPAGGANGPCKNQMEAAYQVVQGSADRGPAWLVANVLTTAETNPGYEAAEALTILDTFEQQQHTEHPTTASFSSAQDCEWACAPTAADAGTYVPPAPTVPIDGGTLVTKTESIIFDANPSCYSCLKSAGCFDDNRGDTNSECEDLAGQVVPAGADAGGGQKRDDLCYATLQCILGSRSCLTDFGAYLTEGACLLGTDAGGCATQEQNGLETTDPTLMIANFNSQATGGGMANRMLNCALSVLCTSCFNP